MRLFLLGLVNLDVQIDNTLFLKFALIAPKKSQFVAKSFQYFHSFVHLLFLYVLLLSQTKSSLVLTYRITNLAFFLIMFILKILCIAPKNAHNPLPTIPVFLLSHFFQF